MSDVLGQVAENTKTPIEHPVEDTRWVAEMFQGMHEELWEEIKKVHEQYAQMVSSNSKTSLYNDLLVPANCFPLEQTIRKLVGDFKESEKDLLALGVPASKLPQLPQDLEEMLILPASETRQTTAVAVTKVSPGNRLSPC